MHGPQGNPEGHKIMITLYFNKICLGRFRKEPCLSLYHGAQVLL